MVQKNYQVIRLERLEHENLASRKKSRVNLKRGILRRGSDEDDTPLFDIRKKCILLGLIKTVDLVHKYKRAQAHMAVPLRLSHHFLNFLNSACNGGKIHEGGLCPVGDDPGQSGLSHTGRSPEYHGTHHVLINNPAQHLSLTQKVLLAHKFLQPRWPQPACQRTHGSPVVKKR